MLPVGALAVALCGLHEPAARDPAVLEGDLLHDRDGQALRALHGAHDSPASNRGVHRVCVQPRVAAVYLFKSVFRD